MPCAEAGRENFLLAMLFGAKYMAHQRRHAGRHRDRWETGRGEALARSAASGEMRRAQLRALARQRERRQGTARVGSHLVRPAIHIGVQLNKARWGQWFGSHSAEIGCPRSRFHSDQSCVLCLCRCQGRGISSCIFNLVGRQAA